MITDMLTKALLTLLLLLTARLPASSQRLHYQPEFLGGYHSLSYAHTAAYTLHQKLQLANYTYIDGAYTSDTVNIYFIRTKLAYHIFPALSIHAAIGMKNPGKFTTLLLQYQYARPHFSISYAAGPTYQNGFTLEQALAASWQGSPSGNTKLYLSAKASINTKAVDLNRGVQQFRIGLRKRKLTHGLGANFDQFRPGTKSLFNAGIFFSYHFEGNTSSNALTEQY